MVTGGGRSHSSDPVALTAWRRPRCGWADRERNTAEHGWWERRRCRGRGRVTSKPESLRVNDALVSTDDVRNKSRERGLFKEGDSGRRTHGDENVPQIRKTGQASQRRGRHGNRRAPCSPVSWGPGPSRRSSAASRCGFQRPFLRVLLTPRWRHRQAPPLSPPITTRGGGSRVAAIKLKYIKPGSRKRSGSSPPRDPQRDTSRGLRARRQWRAPAKCERKTVPAENFVFAKTDLRK